MTQFLPVTGSTRSPLPNSRAIGAVDPKEFASITVRVRSMGDSAALARRAYELGTQKLAERVYLTHDELRNRFGASPADLDAVEQFARKNNLAVSQRDSASRSIVLSGTLGDLMGAFQTDLQMYHHASGTYRGRQGDIGVPPALASVITGVFGFDTRPRRRSPRRMKAAAVSGPAQNNGVPATAYATRYNFPTVAGGVSLDGAGQTIAIIELGGGYQNSDLELYFQKINTPVPDVSWVSVDKQENSPSPANADDGEVMLDIEVAGAVAPKAKIVVYFAPNSGDKGFMDAISAAIHDTERKPSVISISWGGPEGAGDPQSITAFHELFAAAGVLGITICVASGDHGTADLPVSAWDGGIHVDHPASDDLVLACGGTQIDPKSMADVVWNDGTSFNLTMQGGGGWASGGGISQIFPVPAYQQGLNMPPALGDGGVGRGVPDIAMSATDYFTRVDAVEGKNGGTSAVAPLMAALVARLNQAKSKNVGFLNPLLYGTGGLTRDVTTGTNGITNTVKGYFAVAGWDPCTGLGTPIGDAILKAL